MAKEIQVCWTKKSRITFYSHRKSIFIQKTWAVIILKPSIHRFIELRVPETMVCLRDNLFEFSQGKSEEFRTRSFLFAYSFGIGKFPKMICKYVRCCYNRKISRTNICQPTSAECKYWRVAKNVTLRWLLINNRLKWHRYWFYHVKLSLCLV